MKTNNAVSQLIRQTKGIKITGFLSVLMMMVTSILITSCNSDGDNNGFRGKPLANAVVTVKPMKDGKKFYIWMSEDKVGHAKNYAKSPFGDKEVRALANLREEGKDKNGVLQFYVNWMDSIRTKPAVKTLGEKQDIATYGNDPVDVIRAFPTVAEDGYLTLGFHTMWGVNNNKKHVFNLVMDTNPKDPYELEFRHHAHGDVTGVLRPAFIAFRLAKIDSLAKAQGKKKVTLKLKWKSFFGQESVTFDYRVRDDLLKK
ncbi:hypothetical protein HMPREF3034_02225 [Prevotella sp. DNF00663]|uniref:NigD-like protein n=1 Tax=unclassified Prevotella TaxID=2638335 RepID=UPI000689D9DA|nr:MULTISPECIES: NigD-like protein [unclassified Prevotella]KXB79055.1 hypothetical protein HMPREF3034_02225 [Prevotella sp. DNF00663]